MCLNSQPIRWQNVDSRKKRQQENREKKRGGIADKLAMQYVLGDPYPDDHPYAPGSQPVVMEKVEAVAEGRTPAPPIVVDWCRRYLKSGAGRWKQAHAGGRWREGRGIG